MKNIIFDWSGTLIDNQHAMYRAVRRIFYDYKKDLSYKTFKEDFKQPFKIFYSKHLPGISQVKIKKKFIKYYLEEKTPGLITGIRKELIKLSKNNCKLFIFSSHPKKILEKEISKNGLVNIVEKYIGEVYDKKNSLKKFIKKNKLSLKNTYYVGDMVSDIVAAKIARVKSVAVLWGYQKKKTLKLENPSFILHSTKEISKFMK